ncbi:MAG: hypothetical protein ACI9HE_003960 [Planctomycetota bacterium]|jgi:hypothetical protein
MRGGNKRLGRAGGRTQLIREFHKGHLEGLHQPLIGRCSFSASRGEQARLNSVKGGARSREISASAQAGDGELVHNGFESVLAHPRGVNDRGPEVCAPFGREQERVDPADNPRAAAGYRPKRDPWAIRLGTKGPLEAQESHGELDVLPALALLFWAAQQASGVPGGHHLAALALVDLSSELLHRLLRLQQKLGCA